MLRFACPNCGKKLKAPAASAGSKCTCGRCGQKLVVPGPRALPEPAPTAGLTASCPGCARTVPIRPQDLGAVIECSRCSTRFQVGGDLRPPPVPVTEDVPERQGGAGLVALALVLGLVVAAGLAVVVASMDWRKPRAADSQPLPSAGREADPAKSWTDRGFDHFNRRNLKESLAAFNKAIEANPGQADAFYGRGRVYMLSEQDGKAEEDFTRAVELRPRYRDALFYRGIIRDSGGRFQDAVADFSACIDLRSDDAEAHLWRGWVYHRLRDDKRAAADFDRAIAIDPALNTHDFVRAFRLRMRD
jgi:Tfp pilus assembly protein PilF